MGGRIRAQRLESAKVELRGAICYVMLCAKMAVYHLIAPLIFISLNQAGVLRPGKQASYWADVSH